ncbi:unnamed protein product [marine sediment metagenome]|uniref:Uncharacterized protein n=1 Tax=marine sediment metagenome TaxID=412755 RepID=X1RHP8_9ZZZZ
MAQEAIAFAAPRAEEMTRIATVGAGAGIAGLVEGVVVKMAPQMGAAAPILTWGATLGVPLVGVGGALFTKGMLGDMFTGVACGGLGVLCYTLPEMLAPIVGRRAPAQLGGGGVKLLGAGAAEAAQRAQQATAKVGLEF